MGILSVCQAWSFFSPFCIAYVKNPGPGILESFMGKMNLNLHLTPSHVYKSVHVIRLFP